MILVESIDFDSLAEKITKLQSQGKEIKAVFSFIDPFVHLAAVFNRRILPHCCFAGSRVLKMEDKVLTREVIKDLPASPHYAIYTSNDSLEDFIDQQESYLPLIVKSPVSAGSKDVLLANDKNESRQAIWKSYWTKIIIFCSRNI